ncbi:FAD-dependent oxidoreductase [Jiangella aurantiaca]|uniref:FAD-dependent oxidoreductase n=1 Tax=Jiangella aurantiaca TaxID=2530373 RepID=UPI00193DB20D|nr:FAD-dependent oxidoreductase [Jiangella aurantiaca]
MDVLVAGGGLGGVAAALAAARSGANVLLLEETPWLGGQLTTQLVPPDEHPWIESFGCTASYRSLRDGIRDYYRRWYPLRSASRDARHLNPGAGRVGPLCHEPRVALAVIDGLLAPWQASGTVTVLRRHIVVGAHTSGDHVDAVDVRDLETGREFSVTARFVLDATETGDLLPLTGTEHVMGTESRSDTGEPHAADEARPLNQQAVSVCFAVSHHEGEDHTIDKPDDYAAWRDHAPPFWHGAQFGWVAPHPHTLEPRRYAFAPNPDDEPAAIVADQSKDPGSDELWTFRRILARNHFQPGAFGSDITAVNWPMIDYLGGPIIGGTQERNAAHVAAARAQSLSFLYWLQVEAPRPDGGTGWPGLKLRPDVAGTADGLAMKPYVRESRRIRGQYRIVEQDLAVAVRDAGPVSYADSVGVGSYRIDLHPSTGGDNYIDIPAWPFQIPLRALVPQRIRNLLAAGKSVSTTHITNGCYRLHPVEWTVGEAAGLLAAFCVHRRLEPHQVTGTPDLVAQLQDRMLADGMELAWPDVGYY